MQIGQPIQEFSKALLVGVVQCITARGVRQAERSMGELIVFVTEIGFLHVSIEGVVNEGSFQICKPVLDHGFQRGAKCFLLNLVSK